MKKSPNDRSLSPNKDSLQLGRVGVFVAVVLGDPVTISLWALLSSFAVVVVAVVVDVLVVLDRSMILTPLTVEAPL